MKCLISLIILLSFPFSSYGQQIQLVTEDYAPFQIKEEGKPLRGFSIELVEAMKSKAGINSKIRVYPWARAYIMAQRDPNTFIFTIGKTKEREQLFQWVGEFYRVIDALWALNFRQDVVINVLEDAKKYITAVPRRDAAALRLENLGFLKKNHLHYVTRQSQCIQLLHRGRAGLNSNTDIGFFTEVEKLGFLPTDFRVVFIHGEVPMGMAASKGTPKHVVEKMRKALHKVKSDGTHAKLIKKWFPYHKQNKIY